MRYTLVIEVRDDIDLEIEEVCKAVLRRKKPGILVYAYARDAVADVRNVLANSGTPDRLEFAVERLQREWW